MAPIDFCIYANPVFPIDSRNHVLQTYPTVPLNRQELVETAFELRSTPVTTWRPSSIFSTSPLGLILGLTGCANQTPSIEARAPDSNGGSSGVYADAGAGSVSLDAGIDGGSSDPICQVKMSMAVFFYNCVDLAASGQTAQRVCLSDKWYGGDLSQARDLVQSGFEMTQKMYAKTCSPLVIEPKIIFPNRVLNAVQGSFENEFAMYDGKYSYGGSIKNLELDLAGSGFAIQDFAAVVVVNPWDHTILPMHTADTLRLLYRDEAPYARISLNMAVSDPILPVSIKAPMRHENHHAFNFVAERTGFTRLFDAHAPTPKCPYPWDSRWLCMLSLGNDDTPLIADDWKLALGALATPVSCEAPSWTSTCESKEPQVVCGMQDCPDLPGYSPDCNARNFCEYHRTNESQAWHAYDEWIYVPAESIFKMGTQIGDPGHLPSESPIHTVRFSQGYFVGKYEVAVEVYENCEKDQACLPRSESNANLAWGTTHSFDRPLHPVNAITWNQGLNVCEYLYPGARPIGESEWEYAARGLQGFVYPYGQEPPTCDPLLAVFNELGTPAGAGCGTGGTLPIHAMPLGISAVGAFGMAGNLWEWTSECFHSDYTGAPVDGLPWLLDNACDKILRSGAFNAETGQIRAAHRGFLKGNFAKENVGVRCAISAFWVHP